jgi:hypothetical protein
VRSWYPQRGGRQETTQGNVVDDDFSGFSQIWGRGWRFSRIQLHTEWQATSGFDQQARKLDDAFLAGRSRADGLATGSGIVAGLSTVEVPPPHSGSHRGKVGGATVLEAWKVSLEALLNNRVE